jgi:type IV/VI secretion system ImpK/VasF family protein
VQKETADVVYPIFRHGLRLLERSRRGEKLDLAIQQNELRRLFGMANPLPAPSADRGGDAFLGIRYPVACWLDETFSLDPDSPWQDVWEDHTFEWDYFNSRDRSDLFWEQARLAESRGDVNALEVFYLCVMLGFRGRMRRDVPGLVRWRDSVENILGGAQEVEWKEAPPELAVPDPNVPPLRARHRLRWLLIAWAATLGLVIIVTVVSVLGKWW